MISYDEFLKALQIINEYKLQVETDYIRLHNHCKSKQIFFNVPTKESHIYECDISVRTVNALRANNFEKIGDFENYKISDLFKLKGITKRTIDEIKELCYLSGFMINP